MRDRRRAGLLVLAALLVGATLPGRAISEEMARCPRCEHRYVTDVHGTETRGKAKEPCRVCRVVQAEGRQARLLYDHEKAADAETRRKIEAAWEALRKTLRADRYEFDAFPEHGRPRLLAPASKEELQLALFDEALRCERRATWSKQMASALREGYGTLSRVLSPDGPEGMQLVKDMVAAWKEREALFDAAAERYRACAKTLSADQLKGALSQPAPAPEDEPPEDARGGREIVQEIHHALRHLLVLEHASMTRVLALVRGKARIATPASYFARMEELAQTARSTAIVVNVHSRRVPEMDLLRMNLLEDASIEGFIERAPVLAEALKKHAPPVEDDPAAN